MRGAIEQGDQTIGQGDQISPLFHEDGQDDQLINLSILPRWVAGFQAAKAREMRRKRYKSRSYCAGSPVLCRSGLFCSADAVTNGTVFCLPGAC
jgi:hypothetical protein